MANISICHLSFSRMRSILTRALPFWKRARFSYFARMTGFFPSLSALAMVARPFPDW